MPYKEINLDTYYRKDMFDHFAKGAKCSLSITSRLDVTRLEEVSRESGTKFYINFLYLLAKVVNSRPEYRMQYLWQEQKLVAYDRINPTHYIFHEESEKFTSVTTLYTPDYPAFSTACQSDIARAKESTLYALDEIEPHFDASYISWLSYEALHLELPDGYLYLPPCINWGRYREEHGRLTLPLSVRMNHAIADGYLVSKIFTLMQGEIDAFTLS